MIQVPRWLLRLLSPSEAYIAHNSFPPSPTPRRLSSKSSTTSFGSSHAEAHRLPTISDLFNEETNRPGWDSDPHKHILYVNELLANGVTTIRTQSRALSVTLVRFWTGAAVLQIVAESRRDHSTSCGFMKITRTQLKEPEDMLSSYLTWIIGQE